LTYRAEWWNVARADQPDDATRASRRRKHQDLDWPGLCERVFGYKGDSAMKKLLCRGGLPIAICLIAVSAPAAGATFNFSFENDGDLFASSFGTVMVSDAVANQLAFEVSADTSVLGAGADIGQFGFNLDFAGAITLLSGTNSATLLEDASVNGRNSNFDFVVDFGRGQPFFSSVTFIIEGSGLELGAFLGAPVSTQNNKPDALFMAHIQSTSTHGGSESIGGVVPVPAAFWLFGSALGLLGWIRRRVA
jgi:hypothetical protein